MTTLEKYLKKASSGKNLEKYRSGVEPLNELFDDTDFQPDTESKSVPIIFAMVVRDNIDEDTKIESVSNILHYLKILIEEAKETTTSKTIKPFTKEKWLTEVRKAVSASIGIKEFNNHFIKDPDRKWHISADLKKGLIKKQRDALEKSIKGAIKISVPTVEKWARSMWESDTGTAAGRAKLMLAIMVSTGARFIELADPKVSTFSVKGKLLHQKGVAKGKTEEQSNREYSRPVLFFPPAEIVKRLKEIRDAENENGLYNEANHKSDAFEFLIILATAQSVPLLNHR